MWKWLVGLVLLGCGLVCVGAIGGGGWWYWQRLNAERVADAELEARRAEADAKLEARIAEDSDRAANMVKARAAVASGDDAATVVAFGDVLLVEPTNAEALLGRGRALARLERLTEAETDLRAVVAITPKDPEAWTTLAWVLARSNQDTEADAALDALLKLEPDNAKALRDRANANFRSGKLPEARADAARSCALGLTEGCALEERFDAVRR